MKCELCKIKEANKKNTHYLTDSIIRTCLNLDGANDRETGFYFDISNNSPFVSFNFQRDTSIDKLEESLGRQATDYEIKRAKQIPFSVDNVFCSSCEDIFTEIETPFVNDILPKFRHENLDGICHLSFPEIKIIKLFFYLQVWRNSICEVDFKIDDDVKENLRKLIYNHQLVDCIDLPIYPIHVTYLQTKGDDIAYTENFVGSTNDINPNIIFLNDFVIQFFSSRYLIRQIDFYGLNDSNDLPDLINTDNTSFKFKVLSNELRQKLLNRIQYEENAQYAMTSFVQLFTKTWLMIFGGLPNSIVVREYIGFITAGDFDILKYTQESIKAKTNDFIKMKINNNS